MFTTIGHARQSSHDPAVHARLRVVGVQHVDVLAAEDPSRARARRGGRRGDPSRGSTTCSGMCRMPSASSSSTHGPGALIPMARPPRSRTARSCANSRKRRLMSTVVRCATVKVGTVTRCYGAMLRSVHRRRGRWIQVAFGRAPCSAAPRSRGAGRGTVRVRVGVAASCRWWSRRAWSGCDTSYDHRRGAWSIGRRRCWALAMADLGRLGDPAPDRDRCRVALGSSSGQLPAAAGLDAGRRVRRRRWSARPWCVSLIEPCRGACRCLLVVGVVGVYAVRPRHRGRPRSLLGALVAGGVLGARPAAAVECGDRSAGRGLVVWVAVLEGHRAPGVGRRRCRLPRRARARSRCSVARRHRPVTALVVAPRVPWWCSSHGWPGSVSRAGLARRLCVPAFAVAATRPGVGAAAPGQ